MNKVIILLGPTGVGKTGVSILLARALDTEIISADSMQIYRHMDIGTAKPSPGERATVRHHMIDVIDPYESYSTGKYISAIVPVIEALHGRGKIPVIAGGTGLYIKAMTRGIFSGPSADWTLREELLSMEEEAAGSLYAYLKEIDPRAAERITPNDTRRIIRALEVCLKGNTRISEMQKKLTQPLPYEFVKIGLTRERKELYRLIERRVEKMIQEGLIEETKKIVIMLREHQTVRQGTGAESEKSLFLPLSSSRFPSTQAIGYKEIASYLQGELSLDEAIGLIKRGTKRYAKRQFTWFRKEEDVHWVDITGIDDSRDAFLRVLDIPGIQ